MALTDIEKIKLELGLNNLDESLLSDLEIQYFLDKHDGSIKRASLDAAKTVLFYLSRYIHEKSGPELELWGNGWFVNYAAALKMYINNPNFSLALQDASVYLGGLSREDAQSNNLVSDNIIVKVEDPLPTDGPAAFLKDNPFKANSNTF